MTVDLETLLKLWWPDAPAQGQTTIGLFLLLTVLTLAPAIVVLMTSFTRIVVVLAFVRSGLATQQIPPNPVLVGLALFMTAYIMAPTIGTIVDEAYRPYVDGKITAEEAIDRAVVPLKTFMAQSTRQKDLQLFLSYGRYPPPESVEDIPLAALVPAFVVSELTTAFKMGFYLYLPFVVIDLVVASLLMGMGMMMLPPVMVSLPFKVLLFLLVDGWSLVVETLLLSFQR
ncbi:flagellar type III secretion system pore protein FliP [Hydrogenibacillus sp. N12]|uniref:flagellar type III secretion system pore protein FliP n=1 Tax=Hydrogenibacillus sp. N12 TaxID=2866627 RepID=UPI001C7CAD65|nr:flagellar type III secretion system pore protein FliP [Hydrogenibacillus sp. N12]QZA33513.1 flagellar type III secretion system pore protein FliP [Hydrogenibacillus sp. N12]